MSIIHVLCADGSPLGVHEQTIYGDGVQLGCGGSELFMLTMCRAWKEAGHEVVLYNNPRADWKSCFEQKSLDEFDGRHERDYLIIFRSPNNRIENAKGKKIWLSCDQYTAGSFKQFAQKVDQIVTISPYHAQFFLDNYGIENTTTIDIPVREWDYAGVRVERNPLQVLFCSVPDRGSNELLQVWEIVTKEMPEAQLHITSDYRLWDANIGAGISLPWRLKFAHFNNVTYHALVTRNELVKLQLQSSIHLYVCTYEELFCISAAETQYAGCVPVTSDAGALRTTNMGIVIPGDARENIQIFADKTLSLLRKSNLMREIGLSIQDEAHRRFGLKKILQIWDERVFTNV